jgi:hypothetical protein
MIFEELAIDIQDDIMSDVYLSICEYGFPKSLSYLIDDMVDKNVDCYLKAPAQKEVSYMIDPLSKGNRYEEVW